MSKVPLRICCQCGWWHFPCTREQAEEQAKVAGDFFASQSADVQAMYGIGPLSTGKREWSFKSHVAEVEHCFLCGNAYTNFRDATDADQVPLGCTMSAIISDSTEKATRNANMDAFAKHAAQNDAYSFTNAAEAIRAALRKSKPAE